MKVYTYVIVCKGLKSYRRHVSRPTEVICSWLMSNSMSFSRSDSSVAGESLSDSVQIASNSAAARLKWPRKPCIPDAELLTTPSTTHCRILRFCSSHELNELDSDGYFEGGHEVTDKEPSSMSCISISTAMWALVKSQLPLELESSDRMYVP